jgi:integrase
VRRVHAGVRRTIGTAQVGKAPALVADLKKMLERPAGTRVGLRDRALLLGKSRRLGIPFGSSEATCPVRALQAWLAKARIQDGPIFRPLDRFQRVQPTRLSAGCAALIVKRRAKVVGLDPARYSGHSLRARLATSAAAAGGSERVIMSQTGHRSADMVRRYIREGSLFAGEWTNLCKKGALLQRSRNTHRMSGAVGTG